MNKLTKKRQALALKTWARRAAIAGSKTYKPRRAYRKQEESTHIAICRHIDKYYPNEIYHSDASGVRLSLGQAVTLSKLRKAGEKIPDLFLASPKGRYSGLYIEIKNKPEDLFKKNGQVKQNKHIKAQAGTLRKLRGVGYFAIFGPGLLQTIDIIDLYMKNKPLELMVFLHRQQDL